MIDFNRPAYVGRELEYIKDAVQKGMLCGDGEYTKRCSAWMEEISCRSCDADDILHTCTGNGSLSL